MNRVIPRTVRLLELTSEFDLHWSGAEQRLVNRLLSEKPSGRGRIARLLKITDTRLSQLTREIMNRLNPLANAITGGALDPQNARTWPIVLLRLDDRSPCGRRLEKTLLSRHITMVGQLLGHGSPLAKPEFRKGLGKRMLATLEEKLKPLGLVDELAWRVPVPDSRRAWQDEIERRIDELTQRVSDEDLVDRASLDRQLRIAHSAPTEYVLR